MGRPPYDVCEAISRIHIPLTLSGFWLLFSPLLTTPELCSSSRSTLGVVGQKQSHTAREAGHSLIRSHFSWEEKSMA